MGSSSCDSPIFGEGLGPGPFEQRPPVGESGGQLQGTAWGEVAHTTQESGFEARAHTPKGIAFQPGKHHPVLLQRDYGGGNREAGIRECGARESETRDSKTSAAEFREPGGGSEPENRGSAAWKLGARECGARGSAAWKTGARELEGSEPDFRFQPRLQYRGRDVPGRCMRFRYAQRNTPGSAQGSAHRSAHQYTCAPHS